MMQMLEAGGLQTVTDRIRKADEDNPKGHYEQEKVKQMKNDTAWLDDCHGRVIKMISALLHQLPPDRFYKVLFMKRDLTEVLASQKVMLQRLGKEGTKLSDTAMIEKFENHLTQVTRWLSGRSNFDVLYINFRDVIRQPAKAASEITWFLGKPMNARAMGQIVEQKLYRQKSGAGG